MTGDSDKAGLDLVVNAGRFLKRERRTKVFIPATGDEDTVFKLYRRRGFWNTLRGGLVRYRVQREFDNLRYLQEHSIPCTEALGWTHGYSPEHGCYEVLATRRIPGVRDLETLLADGHAVDLAPLISIVRRMHGCGFRHHALYARNVLVKVTEAGTGFYLADVPRARIFPENISGSRMARLDIADLLASLLDAGLPAERLDLCSWGFTATERDAIERMLANYSKTRPRRIARDLESRLRHATACAFTFVANLPLTPGG